jgi:succinate-acetate transporter protein
MMIQCRLASIKGIKLHEWILRFFFGGVVCVLAGLIAKKWGPEIGGLFLAFPAIFPAGASLIESHERAHKARAGIDGTMRGRTVAGIDAAGAAIGCIGLAGFALLCWLLLPRMEPIAVFALATLAWLLLSIAFWFLRKSRLLRTRRGAARHAFRAS